MVTRRRFVRSATLATASVAFPGTRPRRALTPSEVPAFACALPATAVSATRALADPFVQPLRLPPVLAPTDADATTDVFDVAAGEADVEVLPGTTTRMWTYGGAFPGPTIPVTRGREAIVRHRNDLAVPTTVHLHGGHVPAIHDGHPALLIGPGQTRAYRYPNTQLAATLWYHDHRHHHTADTVYRGLAGLYVIHDPDEDALGLPSGDRDIPLVLTDRTFDEDGALIHPAHDGSSFFGDTLLVNGVPQPYVEVEAARYRLRILNASNSRAYRLSLSGAGVLTRVASDGGLLAAPIDAGSVTLYPAERAEVIVDFRGLAGTSVFLEEAFGPWDAAVRFDVTADAPDDATVPSSLRAIAALPPADVVREIVLDFDTRTGTWVMDGKGYDADRIDQYPRLGQTEVWRFTNVSPVEHPLHPHLVMFQVVGRNDGPPHFGDEGWKDTVVVPAGEWVDVAMRFEDHIGRYVYHCHNLEHEDRDMMAQFRVVDLPRYAGPSRIDTAAAIADARFAAPVPVAYVATARDFPDALAAGPAVAAEGGVLVLTERDTLPGVTAAALDRLAPGRIVVLGGRSAVSDDVVTALRSHTTGSVSRTSGATRYETAAAVSASYAARGSVVYVASGRTFADALAGGAAAAAAGSALLLTERDELPAPTARELDRIGPGRIVLLGGPVAVSLSVEQRLQAYAPVTRLAGDDRYATAAAIVADAFPDPVAEVLVATGASFPDALAGAPAAHGAPLLLVSTSEVPAPVAAQLRRLKPRRIVVLGGPGAVSLGVETELAAYLPDGGDPT